MSSMQRYRTIAGTDQAVAFTTAASAQSAAVGSATYAVLLSCSQNVHIEIGPNPTATASTWMLKSTDPGLIMGLAPGDKIAVRGDTAAGTLYMVELTS